jgi:hypothetical protein
MREGEYAWAAPMVNIKIRFQPWSAFTTAKTIGVKWCVRPGQAISPPVRLELAEREADDAHLGCSQGSCQGGRIN